MLSELAPHAGRASEAIAYDEESLILVVNQMGEFIYENGANPDVDVILQKLVNSKYNVKYKMVNIGK